MTRTDRLYLHDATTLAFDSTVVAVGTFDGRASVALGASAFYPESGGQLADTGTLTWESGELRVSDVQLDDAGVVHHLFEGDTALPPAGTPVRGAIDRARRRVHTALHTAQHMLSRALLDEGSAPTISARLGESACTIDLDVPSVAEAWVAKAEALVNDVIDDDRPIRTFFPTPEELAKLALRRAPKVTHDVRVVAIEGFDVSPCGGTHATRSSQVGLVKVTGLERHKGKVRLSFTAGPRARGDLGRAFDLTSALARDLTCGPPDVVAAVDKLKKALSDERAANKQHVSALAELRADSLLATLEPGVPAVLELPGATVERLRSLAGRFTAAGRVAILSGGSGGARPLVVSVPDGSATDAGALLRAIAERGGGRGGGRKNHAEGSLPEGPRLVDLVASS
jgi:alanyl-tRNA synthetase